jgi:hypothetical protein
MDGTSCTFNDQHPAASLPGMVWLHVSKAGDSEEENFKMGHFAASPLTVCDATGLTIKPVAISKVCKLGTV